MLFNSYGFLFFFLPVVLGGFYFASRYGGKYGAGWLVFASLFFYGYWDTKYLLLLLLSIVFNFFMGQRICRAAASGGGRKNYLVAAIVANLLALAYFKYANFFLENVLAGRSVHLDIVLPLGISFYTFTQIAYLVDAYSKRADEKNFYHYTLFVTFFPHLIAGPVLHHKDMMPQFARSQTYEVNWAHLASGLILFSAGLAKKLMFADEFAPYVAAVFDAAGNNAVMLTIYEAWAVALAYTLQIYFDFSGYTDMALGLALMFNIKLPRNFDSPYKATSIINFWRRWHITLSTFLRDYLYISLGGNRKGVLRRYANLFATMLLGGMWHGAGWTFIVWGALHGLYLVVNHLWRTALLGGRQSMVPRWFSGSVCWLLTFVAVVIAWVIFRAKDMPEAIKILQAMFGIAYHPIALQDVLHGHLLVATELPGHELVRLALLGLFWVLILPNSNRLQYLDKGRLSALLQALIVGALLFFSVERFGRYSPFLYFQF
jgi:alginate O-acetyltransferase complex protein AlgI